MIRANPLFNEPLHVGRPNIGDRDRLLARFAEIVDGRWLTNDGPFVKQFEQRLAAYLGARHCVAVSNATVGLELAIAALELTGEIIVPSFTFPATAHAIAWRGLNPVFCDVDPVTHAIDPEAVERLITRRTSGILGVHLWGNPCQVEALTAIAKSRGIKLLFDAAHALGCSHGGRMIGNFGDAEVFSFHATKFVNSGEGGAVVTNDDEFAARLRRLRNFGLDQGDVRMTGTNAKLPELSAAMGLTSLESADAFIECNRDNLAAYENALAGVRGLKLLIPAHGERHNFQYVVVEVDAQAAGMSRDDVVSALHAQNVLAKKYFYPGCHRLAPYRSLRTQPLPHTDRLSQRLLQLPTGTAVSHDDIGLIGEYLSRLIATRARRAA